MLLIFAVFLLFLSFLFYKKWKKYLHPGVIISFSWGIIFLGYELIPHGMYDISLKTCFVLMLWISTSLFGACIFSAIKTSPPKTNYLFFNSSVRSVYYWISVIGIFPVSYIAYKQGTTMDANFWFNLRMANTMMEKSEYQIGILKYVYTFTYVSLLIETYSSDKISNKRIIILFIINIILSIITMAKSSFIFLFIPFCCIKIYKDKSFLKKAIPFLIVSIISMPVIHLLRDNNAVIKEMLRVYTFASIPALDQIVNADTHTATWGYRTFRFFYTVQSSLWGVGISQSSNFINDIFTEGYVAVPYLTNVFTVIFPFWVDFGFWGVIIGGFLFGAFSGTIYRFANHQRAWCIVIYSYLVPVLILQFFGEYLVINLSYLIQLIFLSYFANIIKFKMK